MRDLHALGVSSIVAVDGRYARYPGVDQRSSLEYVADLYYFTEMYEMDLLLYQPTRPWAGDEVEKRQVMIDLAWSIAEEGDWFVVWDCDYKLVEMNPGVLYYKIGLLGAYDFATASFTESINDDGWHPMQMFIRAQKVTMDGNHHTYLLADGRRGQILRRPVPNMADALDLSEIKVRHRVHERDPERRCKQAAYYEQRVET